MTKISKANIVAATALSFLLAAPCVAFAGKSGGSSGGGHNGPSFNYTKVQTDYKPQQSERKKGSGKATFQDMHFMQRNNKASP